MEELGPYDYGPVVPPGCCDDSAETGEVESPIRSNFVILARDDPKVCLCKDRKFTVNLHKDGSWSFTFTNGDSLTEEQIQEYCQEIAGAQSLLESQERWRMHGRGLGQWDPDQNFGFAENGAVADSGTVFFPSGRSNGTGDSCSIQPSVNF